MARPHTFFLQAQAVPWRARKLAERPGLRVKLLSIDKETGALTAILRYPPGFRWQGPASSRADEELFVLDGTLQVNGTALSLHHHALFPAGYPLREMAAPAGADVLTMFSAAPAMRAGDGEGYDTRKLIAGTDTLAMRWDSSLVDPGLPPGAAIKPLRSDPDTGEMTLLYATLAQRAPAGMARPRWTHPMVEEIFLISGEEVWNGSGLAGPGAYFWWRENVWHGPSGSRTGFLMLVRTHGGPLRNTFAPEPTPFTWDTAHTPILPAEHARHARAWRAGPSY